MIVSGARWTVPLSLALAAGCAAGASGPVTVPAAELPSLEAARTRAPRDRDLLVRLGVGYYQAGRLTQAIDVLRAARAVEPSFAGLVYLGLAFEGAGNLDSAATVYQSLAAMRLNRAEQAEVGLRLTNVTQRQLAAFARDAVAREGALSRERPTPNVVAVLPWRYLGNNRELQPLEKGITHLILTDLSRIGSLRLVERERVQALTQEMALTAAQRTEPGTGARSGRLLKAERVVQGTLRDEPRGGNLRLDASAVTTQTGAVAARGSASDRLAELFGMQKRVVLELIGQLGITLSAAERRAIDERPTADLQAFLAFSRGLDARDRGDFAAAAAEFQAAVARDPGFQDAREQAAAANRLSVAMGRTPTQLSGFVTGPGTGGTERGFTTALDALDIVAPSSAGTLIRQTAHRLPLPHARPTEALRQDDPSRIRSIAELIIVIPRP